MRCTRSFVALSLLTSITIALPLFPSAIASEPRAAHAPDFSLPGVSSTKALKDYRGNYLYVDFWASWCGPCRQSFPWMNDMLDKYEVHGLRIIAINLDEQRDDANQFLKQVKADMDIAFDSAGITAESFNVTGMPSSYLINPDGDIVYTHVGFRTRDTSKLEAEIAKLIGGQI